MLSALYVEISAIGIMLLVIILVTQRRTTGFSATQRRFNNLIYTLIAMLVIDAGCWLIDGAQFLFARELNYILETLYYCFQIFLPFLWALYVEYSLSSDLKAARKRIRIATLPLVIFTLALIFNLQSGFVFTIDSNNVYHRASGVYAYSILTFVYLMHGSIRALIKAKHSSWIDDKRRCHTMAFFAVLPLMAGLIQLFYYGISLNWIVATVSAVLVYIDSLDHQISTDSLTGLNNRRELTKYLLREARERDQPRNGALVLIMMDVDGFKQINDTNGHFYGDGVLVSVAEILKESCKNTSAFLARYGGDEFCIVLPFEHGLDIHEFTARILMNVTMRNASHTETNPISLSIGHAEWDVQQDQSYESLISRADKMMYEVKNAKKCA